MKGFNVDLIAFSLFLSRTDFGKLAQITKSFAATWDEREKARQQGRTLVREQIIKILKRHLQASGVSTDCWFEQGNIVFPKGFWTMTPDEVYNFPNIQGLCLNAKRQYPKMIDYCEERTREYVPEGWQGEKPYWNTTWVQGGESHSFVPIKVFDIPLPRGTSNTNVAPIPRLPQLKPR